MKLLARLEESLIAALLAAATLLIFASVTHRYALGLLADLVGVARSHQVAWLGAAAKGGYLALRRVNLVWAQELCIFMFVWMAKFGAAYGVRTGIHVGVDVLVNKLTGRARDICILFGLGCGALFTGAIAMLGARFVAHMAAASAISPDLELPMWLVYMAIPLGSSLMCFRFLQVATAFVRTGALPRHDARHEVVTADDDLVERAAIAAGQLPRAAAGAVPPP